MYNLDMMVAIYKPKEKFRRWYMYLWLHIAVVNSWILYRRDQKELGNKRYLPLRQYCGRNRLKSCLVAANKGRRGKPIPLMQKRTAQGQPEQDVWKDGVIHMLAWKEKCQRCFLCKWRKAFTFVKCGKFQVHLCLNKDRNCFKQGFWNYTMIMIPSENGCGHSLFSHFFSKFSITKQIDVQKRFSDFSLTYFMWKAFKKKPTPVSS